MKNSLKSQMKKYAKSRAAVVATAAGMALANEYAFDEEAPHYAEVTDPLDSVDKGRLLTPEELRKEYESIAISRDIYEQVVTTRSKIGKVASFLLRTAPNAVKMKITPSEKIGIEELKELGIQKKSFTPLVDLGAFPLERFRAGQVDFSKLSENDIDSVVIMEDRAPHFFLNYRNFDPNAEVPLNRHGKSSEKWTMQDLRNLVEALHEEGIKVVIGFWGNTGEKDKNPFVRDNWEALRPVIPTSDDINPLSFVNDENGNQISFGDYVVKQYEHLNRDFKFDGLFLGDGLMGFRSFMDPYGPYDFSDKQYLWTDFYRRVYEGLKNVDNHDTLWAYDCMANGEPSAARRNGIALQPLAKYVDNYIFQSYGNDAWGRDYMRMPGYDVNRDARHIAALPPALKEKTRYSVGLGDAVEGWEGRKAWIREKHEKVSPHAHKGTLGVWSTKIFQNLLQ